MQTISYSINKDVVYLFMHDKILPSKIKGKKSEVVGKNLHPRKNIENSCLHNYAPLLANNSFNASSKCMTICNDSFNLSDVFFLVENTSLLDVVMLSFKYCYTFISFKYYLLHTMNLNK